MQTIFNFIYRLQLLRNKTFNFYNNFDFNKLKQYSVS